MFDVTENDPISPALHALMRLFATDLKAVKFPDMDRAVLEAEAAQVAERAEALARAQASLDAARTELQESQERLLQKGQRALAYVRVFAEEHPELAHQLEGISLPRPGGRSSREADDATAAPKRRGRPPKASGPSASLFTDARAAPEPSPAPPQ
jgi:hypothetical protein